MGPLLMIMAIGIVVLVILVIVALTVPKVRNKIKDALINFKKKMIFNGLIRSITIGFLAYTSSVLVLFLEIARCPKNATAGEIGTAIGMLLPLILFMVGTTVYLFKKKDVL